MSGSSEGGEGRGKRTEEGRGGEEGKEGEEGVKGKQKGE